MAKLGCMIMKGGWDKECVLYWLLNEKKKVEGGCK